MEIETIPGVDEFQIVSFLQKKGDSRLYDVIRKQDGRPYTMEVITRSPNSNVELNYYLRQHTYSVCSFLVCLVYSFQSEKQDYLVLSPMPAGVSLNDFLDQCKTSSEEVLRFVALELTALLVCMHRSNVAYGHLDCENVFFDPDGHVAARRTFSREKYWSLEECYFCNLNRKDECFNLLHCQGNSVSASDMHEDFVALGKLLLKCSTGKNSKEPLALEAPHTPSLHGLVRYLLLSSDCTVDGEKIMMHAYFAGTDWESVYRKNLKPPSELQVWLDNASRSTTFSKNIVDRVLQSKSEENARNQVLEIDSDYQDINTDYSDSSPRFTGHRRSLSDGTKGAKKTAGCPGLSKNSPRSVSFRKRVYSRSFLESGRSMETLDSMAASSIDVTVTPSRNEMVSSPLQDFSIRNHSHSLIQDGHTCTTKVASKTGSAGEPYSENICQDRTKRCVVTHDHNQAASASAFLNHGKPDSKLQGPSSTDLKSGTSCNHQRRLIELSAAIRGQTSTMPQSGHSSTAAFESSDRQKSRTPIKELCEADEHPCGQVSCASMEYKGGSELAASLFFENETVRTILSRYGLLDRPATTIRNCQPSTVIKLENSLRNAEDSTLSIRRAGDKTGFGQRSFRTATFGASSYDQQLMGCLRTKKPDLNSKAHELRELKICSSPCCGASTTTVADQSFDVDDLRLVGGKQDSASAMARGTSTVCSLRPGSSLHDLSTSTLRAQARQDNTKEVEDRRFINGTSYTDLIKNNKLPGESEDDVDRTLGLDEWRKHLTREKHFNTLGVEAFNLNQLLPSKTLDLIIPDLEASESRGGNENAGSSDSHPTSSQLIEKHQVSSLSHSDISCPPPLHGQSGCREVQDVTLVLSFSQSQGDQLAELPSRDASDESPSEATHTLSHFFDTSTAVDELSNQRPDTIHQQQDASTPNMQAAGKPEEMAPEGRSVGDHSLVQNCTSALKQDYRELGRGLLNGRLCDAADEVDPLDDGESKALPAATDKLQVSDFCSTNRPTKKFKLRPDRLLQSSSYALPSPSGNILLSNKALCDVNGNPRFSGWEQAFGSETPSRHTDTTGHTHRRVDSSGKDDNERASLPDKSVGINTLRANVSEILPFASLIGKNSKPTALTSQGDLTEVNRQNEQEGLGATARPLLSGSFADTAQLQLIPAQDCDDHRSVAGAAFSEPVSCESLNSSYSSETNNADVKLNDIQIGNSVELSEHAHSGDMGRNKFCATDATTSKSNVDLAPMSLKARHSVKSSACPARSCPDSKETTDCLEEFKSQGDDKKTKTSRKSSKISSVSSLSEMKRLFRVPSRSKKLKYETADIEMFSFKDREVDDAQRPRSSTFGTLSGRREAEESNSFASFPSGDNLCSDPRSRSSENVSRKSCLRDEPESISSHPHVASDQNSRNVPANRKRWSSVDRYDLRQPRSVTTMQLLERLHDLGRIGSEKRPLNAMRPPGLRRCSSDVTPAGSNIRRERTQSAPEHAVEEAGDHQGESSPDSDVVNGASVRSMPASFRRTSRNSVSSTDRVSITSSLIFNGDVENDVNRVRSVSHTCIHPTPTSPTGRSTDDFHSGKNQGNRESLGSQLGEHADPIEKMTRLPFWRPHPPDEEFLNQQQVKSVAEQTCEDCGSALMEDVSIRSTRRLCTGCQSQRVERKESIIELIQTEANYGQDLRILKEEFYVPLKNNGILSTEQLSGVFLNIQELIDVNSKLCRVLQEGLEECYNCSDEDYLFLMVGELFLSNMSLFDAYERYCPNQTRAVHLLESMQKKSEMLRIFLNVSCKQNPKVRKLDLQAFLAMPVQRIMKYPLLLNRIYKATPSEFGDRQVIRLAQKKIEEKISQINNTSTAKTSGLRKSSSLSTFRPADSIDRMKMTKVVAALLQWRCEDTEIVLHGKFEVSKGDLVGLGKWNRRAFKKLTSLQTLLCVQGASEHYERAVDLVFNDFPSRNNTWQAQDAAVILLKRKPGGTYVLYKEPLLLKHCVVSENKDVPNAFEICPVSKQPLVFVALTARLSEGWLRSLRFVSASLQSQWRNRRGGMSNIMIPTLL